MPDLKKIANPVEALVLVGTENSQLHEELRVVYGELDRYRTALTKIADHPGEPGIIARRALSNS